MTRGSKLSILSAAVLAAIVPNQAHASFTYDLRVAASGNPASASISADRHTVVFDPSNGLGAAGQYTLELWGRITGDASSANDVWTSGLLSMQSTASAAGNALNGGGFVSGQLSSTFPGVRVGTPGDFNGDGIVDWGSNNAGSSTGGTKFLYWNNTTPNPVPPNPGPGFIPSGNVPGLSQPVAGDANSWEVLIATFVVNAGALVAQDASEHKTTLNVLPLSATVKLTATASQPGLTFYQDGSTTAQGTTAAAIGAGVTFDLLPTVVVPEPASIGVLALGGLALLVRRKRA